MKKTIQVHVTGLSHYQDALEQICEHNPDFDLTVSQLTDAGRVGERIYEHLYTVEKAELVLDDLPDHTDPAASHRITSDAEEVHMDSTPSVLQDENESTIQDGHDSALSSAAPQDGLHDSMSASSSEQASSETPSVMSQPPVIGVYADGVRIGSVKRSSCAQVRQLIEAKQLTAISLEIQGGPYRLLSAGEDDRILDEAGEAGCFAMLHLTYEAREEAAADSSNAYISTTYATEYTRKDDKKRGNFFLILSLLLAGFYLAFSGIYWYMIRTGKAAPIDLLGGNLPDQELYLHLGLTGLGLALNIASIFVPVSFLPLLASAAYLCSTIQLPGYALFIALPAIFCVIAALRRRSKTVVMKVIKVLCLPAVIGVLVYYLKPTVDHMIDTQSFAILPHFGDEALSSVELPSVEDAVGNAIHAISGTNDEDSGDDDDGGFEDDMDFDDGLDFDMMP